MALGGGNFLIPGFSLIDRSTLESWISAENAKVVAGTFFSSAGDFFSTTFLPFFAKSAFSQAGSSLFLPVSALGFIGNTALKSIGRCFDGVSEAHESGFAQSALESAQALLSMSVGGAVGLGVKQIFKRAGSQVSIAFKCAEILAQQVGINLTLNPFLEVSGRMFSGESLSESLAQTWKNFSWKDPLVWGLFGAAGTAREIVIKGKKAGIIAEMAQRGLETLYQTSRYGSDSMRPSDQIRSFSQNLFQRMMGGTLHNLNLRARQRGVNIEETDLYQKTRGRIQSILASSQVEQASEAAAVAVAGVAGVPITMVARPGEKIYKIEDIPQTNNLHTREKRGIDPDAWRTFLGGTHRAWSHLPEDLKKAGKILVRAPRAEGDRYKNITFTTKPTPPTIKVSMDGEDFAMLMERDDRGQLTIVAVNPEHEAPHAAILLGSRFGLDPDLKRNLIIAKIKEPAFSDTPVVFIRAANLTKELPSLVIRLGSDRRQAIKTHNVKVGPFYVTVNLRPGYKSGAHKTYQVIFASASPGNGKPHFVIDDDIRFVCKVEDDVKVWDDLVELGSVLEKMELKEKREGDPSFHLPSETRGPLLRTLRREDVRTSIHDSVRTAFPEPLILHVGPTGLVLLNNKGEKPGRPKYRLPDGLTLVTQNDFQAWLGSIRRKLDTIGHVVLKFDPDAKHGDPRYIIQQGNNPDSRVLWEAMSKTDYLDLTPGIQRKDSPDSDDDDFG